MSLFRPSYKSILLTLFVTLFSFSFNAGAIDDSTSVEIEHHENTAHDEVIIHDDSHEEMTAGDEHVTEEHSGEHEGEH